MKISVFLTDRSSPQSAVGLDLSEIRPDLSVIRLDQSLIRPDLSEIRLDQSRIQADYLNISGNFSLVSSLPAIFRTKTTFPSSNEALISSRKTSIIKSYSPNNWVLNPFTSTWIASFILIRWIKSITRPSYASSRAYMLISIVAIII